jgi:hypothetical protein
MAQTTMMTKCIGTVNDVVVVIGGVTKMTNAKTVDDVADHIDANYDDDNDTQGSFLRYSITSSVVDHIDANGCNINLFARPQWGGGGGAIGVIGEGWHES